MRRVGKGRRPGTRRIDESCCSPRWAVARSVGRREQLRVELATSASAVVLNVDIHTGLSGPLEGSQALQRLPIHKPMI